MDEKRKKIKQYIEESLVSAELKAKELEIVNNEDLSTPEVEIALTKLIAEEFDATLDASGVVIVEQDEQVADSFKAFSDEAGLAEKDLEADMDIVQNNLKAIEHASDQVTMAVLEAKLGIGKE